MTIDLKELRRLEAAATPGSWEAFPSEPLSELDPVICAAMVCAGDDTDDQRLLVATVWREEYEDDADVSLIVAMRNALPALLDELDELDELRNKWSVCAEKRLDALEQREHHRETLRLLWDSLCDCECCADLNARLLLPREPWLFEEKA